MASIRYVVAASLDGYIAGPNGESDWIFMDPEIDFAALTQQFGTALMGRKSYQTMRDLGQDELPGIETIVFSTTLEPGDVHPNVRVVNGFVDETAAALKATADKDIWLFGGGEIFRTLAQYKLVDTVEVAIMPVLLGGGIPLFPPPASQIKLHLKSHKVYRSGIVSLEYDVV